MVTMHVFDSVRKKFHFQHSYASVQSITEKLFEKRPAGISINWALEHNGLFDKLNTKSRHISWNIWFL